MVICREFASFAILSVISVIVAQSDFEVPEVKLEGLKSGGFRAYIPDVPGTSSFTFHANINEDISHVDPGKIVGEATSPDNGYWIVNFNNTLKSRDRVDYWVFVSANRLGYRKDGSSWFVQELLDAYKPLLPSCDQSTTILNGKKTNVCVGTTFFQDNFDGPTINTGLWTVQHRIPTYSEPNYEFNTYENRNETRFIKDGKLFIKPIAVSENEVRGVLNLRDGCTASIEGECFYQHASAFLLPPVKSAKITSRLTFQYAKIEIRAKLPAGDWIFPIIELEPKDKSEGTNAPKLLIAYSRGNDHLNAAGLEDIGSRVLFAGPMLHPTEPGRSKRLIKRPAAQRYSNDYHVYGLEWKPGLMSFMLDHIVYGTITTGYGFAEPSLGLGSNWNVADAPFNKEYTLSIGVAVGGINDFPDGYSSGSDTKPWVNGDRNYIKNFFDSKNVWSKTWKGDETALQIDYVKIWTI